MHIVFLSNEYPLWSPGGIGSFIQTLGRSLVQEEHTICVIGMGNTSSDEIIEDEGVLLYRLKRKKSFLPEFVFNTYVINKKLKALHKEKPIDIIEASELGLAFVSKHHPAKKIIRLHGGHHFFAEAEKRGINWKKGWMEKKSFSNADAFIGVSNFVKEHTQKYLSYHGKPLKVIRHPIDTSVGIPKEVTLQNHILFAGTVCEKKGVSKLIEGFKIVRKKYPEMHLDIFGRDWHFPDGSSYIEFLKNKYDNSLFEQVRFHGSVSRDQLFKEYVKASICIFPSYMETQGLVVLEAMLLKKPVIFTQYGPGAETIAHKDTGLLCDVYNPEDIAEKICWYIENREKASEIGKNARQLIKKNYDFIKIRNRNIKFYESLIRK